MQPHYASLWCAHPHIRPGEALSSWLHRSAFANGLTNHCYARRVLPDLAVWNRDIDRLADVALLEQAASATGEEPARLREATLRSFEGKVFGRHSLNGWLPWVMPIGVFHRLRLHHGHQFCAACLADQPIAKLTWRLAWQLYCPTHRIRLRDGCPHCDAPFAFHRVSLAIDGRVPCHICGYNLAKPALSLPRHSRAWNLQRTLGRALASEEITVGPFQVSALEYSLGLRILARGITNRTHLSGLIDTMPRNIRMSTCRPSQIPAQPFEYWRLSARELGLEILARVAEDWPDQFVWRCRRSGLYRCRFDSNQGTRHPEWVESGLRLIER